MVYTPVVIGRDTSFCVCNAERPSYLKTAVDY